MSRQIGSPELYTEEPSRWTSRDAWPPEDARDAWWEDESSPTARAEILAEWHASPRQVTRWLFMDGGIILVLLIGLVAFVAVVVLLQPW